MRGRSAPDAPLTGCVVTCVRIHETSAHTPMTDILYILGTLAFFALMLAYVAGCARLGQVRDDTSFSSERRP